jgi:hypothetical protein
MSLVQMKPIQGLFWVKESRLLTIVLMSVEASIPLTHQLMDPFCKELPGLLLESLHHHSLDVFVHPESLAI